MQCISQRTTACTGWPPEPSASERYKNNSNNNSFFSNPLQLKIQANEGKNHRSAPVLTRDDLRPSQGLEMPHKSYVQYPVILGGSLSYILHWTAFLPQTVFITGRGIQRSVAPASFLCVGN